MNRLVVIVLGNRNSGKSNTWYELFDRVIRSGYKKIYFNKEELEIFVKNSSFEETGKDVENEIFVRNASFEEYGDNVDDYFDKGNLPEIVFCSVQYKEKGIETMNFFKNNNYYIYIQWLNPGYLDSKPYDDYLKFEEIFKDFGEFHIENGKEKEKRALKIKEFVYNWIKNEKPLNITPYSIIVAESLHKEIKNALESLQDQFAFVDLINKKNKKGLELLIKELKPLEFTMTPDKNHKRPHIHINYGKEKHAASYSIDNGEILAGNLESIYARTVKSWVAKNKDKLFQLWNEMQAGNLNQYELLIGQLKAS